jgi:hypothetical protein
LPEGAKIMRSACTACAVLLPAAAGKAQVVDAMKGHIVAGGRLQGSYGR